MKYSELYDDLAVDFVIWYLKTSPPDSLSGCSHRQLQKIWESHEELRRLRAKIGGGDESWERTLIEVAQLTGVSVLELQEMGWKQFLRFAQAAAGKVATQNKPTDEALPGERPKAIAADDPAEKEAAASLETAVAVKAAKVDAIAKKLTGKRPAIFRYLCNNPCGVTFGEFMAATDNNSGHRLTASTTTEGVTQAIKRLSRELRKTTRGSWWAVASPGRNLITIEGWGGQK